MKRWSFVIASALLVQLTILRSAGAQAMKTPGQSSSQSNVVKPAPLDFSPELLRSLRLPAGFKIEKFVEGLKTPRVIVVGPKGRLYVSSRDEGTITFLSDRGGMADGGRIVLRKPNVHGIAVREGELFYITIREIFAAPIAADGSIGTERSDLPDAQVSSWFPVKRMPE